MAQNWRSIRENDPKRLPKLIEAGIKLRDARKALEAEAAKLQADQRALEDYLINTFQKDDLREVKTASGTGKLVPKSIPQKDDATGGWDAIWKYIIKNKAYDLLQKRLHESAVKARWEAKEKIPGVKEFVIWVFKFGDAE